LRTNRTGQNFKRFKCNGNAIAISEQDVSMGHGMLFTAVDTNLPIIFTVCRCHIGMIVYWLHYVNRKIFC